MSLLVLLGMLLVYEIISIYESAGTMTRPFTEKELNEISRQIIGKSQREAREIVNRYK